MKKWRTIIQGVIGLLLLFVVPFLLAGRWDLPMVWATLGLYAGLMALLWLVVLRKDPELVHERQHSGPDAKHWDRIWLAIYSVFVFGTFGFAVLDVGRLGWSLAMPRGLQIAALAVMAGGMALAGWALASNRFFSEVVRIQRDRGHHVVTSGPYRYVRHPGYAANLLIWPALALAIGSWWALLPAGIVDAMYVLRTSLEDRTLLEELEGYAEYARNVPYRLLPGVW